MFQALPVFDASARFVQRACFGVPMNLILPNVWNRKPAARRSRRAFGLNLLTGVALLVMAVTRATAAVHPVPLDPTVDSKKCL